MRIIISFSGMSGGKDVAEGSRSLLVHVGKRKYFFFTAGLIAALAAVTYNYYNPPLYKSTVLFLLEGKADIEGEASTVFAMGITPNATKVNRLIKSAEMYDHLIDRLDLYSHYKLQEKDAFRKVRLYRRLDQVISLSQLDARTVSISVRDRKQAFAVKLANAIFKKIKLMSDKELRSSIKRYRRYNRALMESMELRTRTQLKEFAEALDSLSQSTAASELKVAGLAASIVESNHELMKSAQDLEVVDNLGRTLGIPQIKLLRTATPDIRTFPKLIATGRLLGCVLASQVFSLLLLLFWVKNQDEVRDLLSIPESYWNRH